ncbi:MAG: hypothetical protein C0614_09380, partial [Desulfuromonas sp.]
QDGIPGYSQIVSVGNACQAPQLATITYNETNDVSWVTWHLSDNCPNYILTQNGTDLYSGPENNFMYVGVLGGTIEVMATDINNVLLVSPKVTAERYTPPAPVAVSAPRNLQVPGSDPDGDYWVVWTSSETNGVTYVLTENSVEVYRGSETSYRVSGNIYGTYDYMLKAVKTGSADSPEIGPLTTEVRVGNIDWIDVPAGDSDGSYWVSWAKSATSGVTYTLYENGSQAYQGTSTSFLVTGKGSGNYGYTVKASESGSESPLMGPATTVVAPAVRSVRRIMVPSTDADGKYWVSWWPSRTAGVEYVLTENGSQIYQGTGTAYRLAGKGSGSYTYAVKAIKTGWADSPELSGTVTVTIP